VEVQAGDARDRVSSDLIEFSIAMLFRNHTTRYPATFPKESGSLPFLGTDSRDGSHLPKAAREAGFRRAVTKSSSSEVVTAVETLLGKGTFFDIEGPRPLMADPMGIRYLPDCLASVSCAIVMRVRICA
jgi:hypothetical protein